MDDDSTTAPSNIEGPNDLYKPCKIVDVSFDGARKTEPRLLAKMVSDIFSSNSLMDCLQRSVQVRESLKSLDAFTMIQLQVEPVNEDDDEYRVTFKVEERGRVVASTQVSMDNRSDTHANLGVNLPNLSGRGDSIRLTSKFNPKLYSCEYRYTLPVRPWKQIFNPICSLFYLQDHYSPRASGFDQEDKALNSQVDFYSTPNTSHNLSFENVWRAIKASSSTTPVEIREQAGHSVKSSFRHTVCWDNRVGENFPTKGILASLSNEVTLSLVKNCASFSRHEASLQLNAPLLTKYGLVCQLNLRLGTLINPSRYNICDKFFVGGPLSVRGFLDGGLGTNFNGYPFGDLSYLTAGLHLYSNLPFTSPKSFINNHIRPHVFVNSGTIGNLNGMRRPSSIGDIERDAQRFRDSLRYSCGFGLVMYAWNVRFELNYCFPLISKNNDLTKTGPQFGFGLKYF